MPLADWHVVLTQAVLGDGAGLAARAEAMAAMTASGRYPAGPAIAALGQAFAAMARQDFVQAINAIEPMLAERERIGGSRAQVDLVEATLLKAYLGTGRLAEMRRLLAAGGPARQGCRWPPNGRPRSPASRADWRRRRSGHPPQAGRR